MNNKLNIIGANGDSTKEESKGSSDIILLMMIVGSIIKTLGCTLTTSGAYVNWMNWQKNALKIVNALEW